MYRIVERTHISLPDDTDGYIMDIIADSEDDIKGLGAEVDYESAKLTCAPGSIAYTADAKAVYMLSPSGVWTKVGGA